MKAVFNLAFVCLVQQAPFNHGDYDSLGGYSVLGWGGTNCYGGYEAVMDMFYGAGTETSQEVDGVVDMVPMAVVSMGPVTLSTAMDSTDLTAV